MKKTIKLFVLILSFIIVMLPVQAAEFDLIYDEIGLLTDDESFELNELAQDITEQYQCEVSIVIVEDKGDDNIIDYTKYIYHEYGYGYGEDKSGLMLLISMEERDYALFAYGYGNVAFTDYGKNVLEDNYLLPQLGKDNYYDAFSTYLNQTAVFLNMAKEGTAFDVNTDEDEGESFLIKIAIVIFVPLLIAGIVCFIFLQQMKTAVAQKGAKNYISDEGVNLTMRADEFLYRTETRTKKEDKSSSNGTTIDSDGSSSSSGKF